MFFAFIPLLAVSFTEQPKEKDIIKDAFVRKHVRDLRSPEIKIRIKAAQELKALGKDAEEATEALIKAMFDASPRVREAAIEALEKVAPDIHKPIVAILLDSNQQARVNAFHDLGRLGADAEPAVSFLVEYLKLEFAQVKTVQSRGKLFSSPSGNVELSITALREIKTKNKVALKALNDIATAPKTDPATRILTIDTIDSLSADDDGLRKMAYPSFKFCMVDADPKVSAKAIGFVGTYGNAAKDSLVLLRKLKLSNSGSVRDAAAAAIEKIDVK